MECVEGDMKHGTSKEGCAGFEYMERRYILGKCLTRACTETCDDDKHSG